MNRKLLFAVLGLVALIVALPWLSPRTAEHAPPPTHGMPWQIELPAPGQSRVFGLRLGGADAASLADARLAFPAATPQLAVLAPQGGPLALEAYFDNVAIGPLTGKLVLGIAATAAEIEAIRDRADRTDHLGSGLRKFIPTAADRDRAERMPLAGIAFIPAASLDEAIIVQRFGPPAERIRQGETLEHFLYPALGLDVVLDSKGKEVLQYVAPADFDRLRAPLGRP